MSDLRQALKDCANALAYTVTNVPEGGRPHWCSYEDGNHSATCQGMMGTQDAAREALAAPSTPEPECTCAAEYLVCPVHPNAPWGPAPSWGTAPSTPEPSRENGHAGPGRPLRVPGRCRAMSEEDVVRDWVAAMTNGVGAPLPPSQRRAEPLPRRRVLPVIVTLLDIIDGLRAEHHIPHVASGPFIAACSCGWSLIGQPVNDGGEEWLQHRLAKSQP